MAKIKNRIGEKYGHWIVREADKEKTLSSGKTYWICECDCGCGTTKSIRTDALYQVKVGGCDNMVMSEPKICSRCGEIFYPKKQAKTRRYCYNCVSEESAGPTDTRRKIKQWGLEYKGSQCSICGYDKCPEALDFHHIDESKKSFSLSDHGIKLDWPLIKEELDKCIVVCANCHREIHAGYIEVDI